MTKAQELYNEFITLGWKCITCDKHFKFSQVTRWGDREGGASNVTCPFCKVSLRIDLPEVVRAIEKLGNLDKKIINVLIEYADEGGEFHGHGPYDEIYYKCIMVLKYNPLYTSLITIRPLPFVERMVMIQIYRELVEAGKIEEVDLYEVQAPIPVVSERAKVKTVRYGKTTQAYENSRKKKEKKSKVGTQLDFMVGGGIGTKKKVASELTPDVLPELDDAIAGLMNLDSKPLEDKVKDDLSSLDDMINDL